MSDTRSKMVKSQNNGQKPYKKSDHLKKRKAELENELKAVESRLEQTVGSIRKDLTEKSSPTYWVRKFPLQTVGLLLATGLVLGLSGGSGKGDNGKGKKEIKSYDPGFMTLLSLELKRIASRKVIDLLSDQFDKQMAARKDRNG